MVRRAGPGFAEGSGDRDKELLFVLASEARGLPHWEIAVAIWGPKRVAAEYEPDGWMHSRTERRLRRARALLKGYRELATGA